jgi:hypothetical protein
VVQGPVGVLGERIAHGALHGSRRRYHHPPPGAYGSQMAQHGSDGSDGFSVSRHPEVWGPRSGETA